MPPSNQNKLETIKYTWQHSRRASTPSRRTACVQHTNSTTQWREKRLRERETTISLCILWFAEYHRLRFEGQIQKTQQSPDWQQCTKKQGISMDSNTTTIHRYGKCDGERASVLIQCGLTQETTPIPPTRKSTVCIKREDGKHPISDIHKSDGKMNIFYHRLGIHRNGKWPDPSQTNQNCKWNGDESINHQGKSTEILGDAQQEPERGSTHKAFTSYFEGRQRLSLILHCWVTNKVDKHHHLFPIISRSKIHSDWHSLHTMCFHHDIDTHSDPLSISSDPCISANSFNEWQGTSIERTMDYQERSPFSMMFAKQLKIRRQWNYRKWSAKWTIKIAKNRSLEPLRSRRRCWNVGTYWKKWNE